MLDIHKLMSDLSKHHPRFNLEEDFKHALKRQIRKAMSNSDPHLEYKIKNMSLDIYVPTERIAIELKHRLPHRNANYGRYYFLEDVERIERVVKAGKADSGFAVLLTNYQTLWGPPRRGWETTTDAAFRLHEGRTITGKLAWSDKTAESTKEGREDPICLTGSYRLHWRDYSSLGTGTNQQFRYLAVSVK